MTLNHDWNSWIIIKETQIDTYNLMNWKRSVDSYQNYVSMLLVWHSIVGWFLLHISNLFSGGLLNLSTISNLHIWFSILVSVYLCPIPMVILQIVTYKTYLLCVKGDNMCSWSPSDPDPWGKAKQVYFHHGIKGRNAKGH